MTRKGVAMQGKVLDPGRIARESRLLEAVSARLAPPRLAHALCAEQPEDGSWVNSDPNTRSLTRAKLRFICQDQVHNGQIYPPGPPWYIHLWGKCHPADCDWGEVGAQWRTVGMRDYIYTVYHHGFATRYVYADMSQSRPGQLWIWMWTNFTDPGRSDYASSNWFRRA